MKKNLMCVIIVAAFVIITLGTLSTFGRRTTANHSGSLYVSVTDASDPINNVNDINMAVEKVEIHSSQKGWITVAELEKVYPLLSLKDQGALSLYARKSNLDSGYYDKAKVTLGNVTVRTKNNTSLKAALPSKDIEIDIAIRIKDNSGSDLKLDFLADRSLHLTTDGQYIFTPVVNVHSESGVQIAILNDNKVNIIGGTTLAEANVGVDLDGTSKKNFQVVMTNDPISAAVASSKHTAANNNLYNDKNSPLSVRTN